MIKFFRHIRKSLLNENKFTKYLLYAIGEIVLVVIGILIALSINNWNENRKDRIQEQKNLEGLLFDLKSDIEEITGQLKLKEEMVNQYFECLDILSNKKKATKQEFIEDFKTILVVGGVSLNQTTFNNLEASGQISLIKNKALSDSIIKYYNSDYLGWEGASREYTRNILAPFFLNFDFVPHYEYPGLSDQILRKLEQVNDYEIPEKSLDDYKTEYFIINALRQKIYNTQGLVVKYQGLLKQAMNLEESITNYLNSK